MLSLSLSLFEVKLPSTMAEETTRLYDSTICRFCAENNENGEPLFGEDQDDPGISLLINRYLPLKVTITQNNSMNRPSFST